MISLNFYSAVSLYVFACVAGVFIAWFFNKKEKDKNLSLDNKFVWFCSVCSYAYVNTAGNIISLCPRCGSYNKK